MLIKIGNGGAVGGNMTFTSGSGLSPGDVAIHAAQSYSKGGSAQIF